MCVMSAGHSGRGRVDFVIHARGSVRTKSNTIQTVRTQERIRAVLKGVLYIRVCERQNAQIGGIKITSETKGSDRVVVSHGAPIGPTGGTGQQAV